MKFFFPLVISVALHLQGIAQKGTPFPDLTGETLENKTLSIPSDTRGKMTLVGMAFSKKSEEALKSWYQPVYDKFIAKLGMFDGDYDIRVLFVPMYIGLKQTAYQSTLKELRQTHRQDLFPYILFYKGELEPYGSKLGLSDKSLPYFFLLDENGRVLYATSGFYNDQKMEEIEELIGSH
ncbi:MAG: hypothetical protein IT223_09840 [Crocinitomicaceae bacterium]|nr:hypothetical protein [Crocinitomicaceae bacterium]